MTIESKFGIIDVEGEAREGLEERIKKGEKIPVVIRGVLEDIWGNFDGTSQEFQLAVSKIEVTA